MDKEFEIIKNKNWNDVTKEDLEYLIYKMNFLRFQIAETFNVTKSQVSSKMRKFDVSIQRKMLGDALDNAIRSVRFNNFEE